MDVWKEPELGQLMELAYEARHGPGRQTWQPDDRLAIEADQRRLVEGLCERGWTVDTIADELRIPEWVVRGWAGR